MAVSSDLPTIVGTRGNGTGAYDRRQSTSSPSRRPSVERVSGRRIDASQLVGAAEIAERLEVTLPQTVHDWRRRHQDFPTPVAVLKMGMVWNWPDVEAWARRTGRLRRR